LTARDRDREIWQALGRGYDYESMAAVANLYRTATGVRYRIERDLLAEHGLSWGGFTALFVLRVWGPMESFELADECGLAKGTLTGVVTTLERAGLVERDRLASDRRRVVVSLTRAGNKKIDSVFPQFNRFETKVTADLSRADKRKLTELLIRVRLRAEDGESR
jgi:DNA-binding MarR family transcriptional regulator